MSQSSISPGVYFDLIGIINAGKREQSRNPVSRLEFILTWAATPSLVWPFYGRNPVSRLEFILTTDPTVPDPNEVNCRNPVSRLEFILTMIAVIPICTKTVTKVAIQYLAWSLF